MKGQLNQQLAALILFLLVVSIVFLAVNRTQAGVEDIDPDLCGVIPRFRCMAEKSCDAGWTLAPGEGHVCPEGEGRPYCCYLYDPDEYYPEGTILLELAGARQALFRVAEVPLDSLNLEEGYVPLPRGAQSAPLSSGTSKLFAVYYEEGYAGYRDFFLPADGPTGTQPIVGIPKNVKISLKYKPGLSPKPVGGQQVYAYCHPDMVGLLTESGQGTSVNYLGAFEGYDGKRITTEDGMPPKYSCENTEPTRGMVTVLPPLSALELSKKTDVDTRPTGKGDTSTLLASFSVVESYWLLYGNAMSPASPSEKVAGKFLLPISKHLEGER